jgi:hypothetical protein
LEEPHVLPAGAAGAALGPPQHRSGGVDRDWRPAGPDPLLQRSEVESCSANEVSHGVAGLQAEAFDGAAAGRRVQQQLAKRVVVRGARRL